MGKLLCDSTTVTETFQNSSPWKDQKSMPVALDAIEAVDLVDQGSTIFTTTATSWDKVHGLEEQQRCHLQRLHAKGVLWKHPEPEEDIAVVFRLSHGGEVSSDRNCLFTASMKAMEGAAHGEDARELQRQRVRRFLEDFGSVRVEEEAIRHMYAPDLKNG